MSTCPHPLPPPPRRPRRCPWPAAIALLLGAPVLASARPPPTGAAPEAAPWERGSYEPAWSDAPVRRRLRIDHDGERSDRANGRALAGKLRALEPGDRLAIGPGRYVMAGKLTLEARGTAEAPIRIAGADPDRPPTITRPDAQQNLLNVGERGPARYVLLRGLELTGGSVGIRSGDNVMQVQGQALVRNNVLLAGAGAGFASTAHRGRTRDLAVVHNTIINTGRGANLSSWNGRSGMLWANNAVYSEDAPALRFPDGAAGVKVTGNVIRGAVQGVDHGFQPGRGLEDFRAVTWDAAEYDARPSEESALRDAADRECPTDAGLRGLRREAAAAAGIYALPEAPCAP